MGIIISLAPLDLLSNHGPNESNEGDEGRSQGYDCKRSVQRCRRDNRPEGKRREGHHGGHRCGCGRRVEEEWFLQARRCAQSEAQEEASDASQERCEPIHKGTMCLQSQACVEDRQGIAYEEAQGDGQLESLCSELASLRGRGGRTRRAFLEHCTSVLLDRGSVTL